MNEEHKRKIAEGNRKTYLKKWQNPEYKKRMSEAHKNQVPWNRGKKLLSVQHIKNLSVSHEGYVMPDTQKKAISEGNIGKRCGSLSHFWLGGRVRLQNAIRHCFKYRQWRSDVFTRDDFTCQKCGIKGGNLNADHVKPFSYILTEYNIQSLREALTCEELWNINNGRTLCRECHKLTATWGINQFT